MTELHTDVQEDYDAMCALLGPLDYRAFCEGYRTYERWKMWRPQAQQPEMELALAS